MPKAKKPATCHPDRDHYAKGLCLSCYQIAHRKKTTKVKCDRDYEDRHRQERNEKRRLYAAKWRAKKAHSQSSESSPD